MKRWLITLLLVLSVQVCVFADGDEMNPFLGQEMYDFTVNTIDGGSFTLSEALKDYDMVLINMWATWCGPCRMEFPYMEEAWEKVQDKVADIAVSVEETDDEQKLKDFAEEYGMQFSVGSDTAGLADYFKVTGIPTSVVVDRFGRIAWMESGSITSSAVFDRLFNTFIREDYTETVMLTEIPPAKPVVQAPSEEELAQALNVEGGGIAFRNDGDELVWPMVPAEDSDRLAVKSSNAGQIDTTAVVIASVAAEEGDVLAFDFKTSVIPVTDTLLIAVDGKPVKNFSGEHEWSSYAFPLEEGEHEVTFTFKKGSAEQTDEDAVWLDNICLKSGEEAEEALAANPVYLTADETTLKILNETARKVAIDDPNDVLYMYFGSTEYWVLNDTEARVAMTLTEDIDPEAAFSYCDADGEVVGMMALAAEDRYERTVTVDTKDTTGYSYTNIYLYPSLDAELDEIIGIMVFADEENLNDLIEEAKEDGVKGWSYLEETGVETQTEGDMEEAESAGSGEITYRVLFADEDGKPVEGVALTFCTDEQCVMVISDENGVAEYAGVPYEYHVQLLQFPEGYSYDGASEFETDLEGTEIELTLTK